MILALLGGFHNNYPLVNMQKAMEHHRVEEEKIMENQLRMSMLESNLLTHQRVNIFPYRRYIDVCVNISISQSGGFPNGKQT